MLGRVERLRGVKLAAPLLEQTATIESQDGASVTVNLAGAAVSLAVLDGLVHTLPIATLEKGGMGLSMASASALGIRHIAVQSRGPEVSLALRGRAIPLRVNAVLGAETVGALSQARVAVMPLERLQRFAGLPHRLTRILVQSSPGRQALVLCVWQPADVGFVPVGEQHFDAQAAAEAVRRGVV